MERFTQAQAAMLTGYDERAFRSLVDKGIVLPSPETRSYGRGKAKTFTRDELRLTSVFREIDPLLDPLQKVEISSWLRTELAPIARQSSEKNPCYLALETGYAGAWRTEFRTARGDYVRGEGDRYVENEDRKISVIMDAWIEGEEKRPANRLMLVNITAALRAIDNDEFVASVLAQEENTDNEPASA